MRLEDAIVRETGCSPRQLERWAGFGLLHREQRWPTGHRGSVTLCADDTAARVRIILAHLGERQHTLTDAAFELLLQGFDLPDTRLLRRVLQDYVDRMIELSSLGLHEPIATQHSDSRPPATRAQLQRKVRTAADRSGLSNDAHDVLKLAVLGVNGIMPRSVHGAVLPDNSLLNWPRLRDLLDPSRTTDARLAQALGDARERLATTAEHYTAALQTMFGLSPEDVVRALLPGHICKTRHTPAQALLPRAVLGRIDPDPSASAAQWKYSELIDLLKASIAEIGGRLGPLDS